MGASTHVGRIGGLAAALGIGVAIGLGCGVASADTTGQSSSADSPSSSSGSEAKSTADSSAGHTTGSSSLQDDTGTPTKIETAKPVATVTIASKPNRGSHSTTAKPGPDSSTTAKPSKKEPSKETTADDQDSATKDTKPTADTKPTKDPKPAGDAKPSEVEPTSVLATAPETGNAVAEVPPAHPVPAHDTVTAAAAGVVSVTGSQTGGSPVTPPDSPVSWTVAAAARKETLVPATRTPAAAASTLATPTPTLVDTTPPMAVIQTPPLAWLQQIPVIGPVFITPVVAAIHMIPIVGDIIHPLIGYPVQPGSPGAPVPRDVMVTSFDGTQIYVHFMPAAGLPAKGVAPTILEGPGLGMPGSTSLEVTPLDGILTDALGAVGVGTLRHAGYNVVTWDPRGEYRSGGTLELDSADYEARDVSAIISWLATQPEAQLDSPGDPRMGMVGASYGGGIQWTTAATDHRVDAIVPSISWNTLNTSL
ncbi:CocE/NonD family hydrolase [Mycobacterium sp. NPDC006124]|uniref:alpha/beta hydrolase n=1 Tax=Mycobacterium sp. NPDC006124 TaxID=3156729 RepID=UPI0033A1BA8A